MFEKDNDKELNQETLDQASGGNIIDDAVFDLVNITNSVMTEVNNELAKSSARGNNTAALRAAAQENGITETHRNPSSLGRRHK